MAHVLIMPRQGNTVESCIINEWKIEEGETVKSGTTVCIVETDKATFDVPAGADGVVLKILHPAGEDVPVLQPIAVIGTTSENWQAALGTKDDSHGSAEPQSTLSEESSRRDTETHSIASQNNSHKDTKTQSDMKEPSKTAEPANNTSQQAISPISENTSGNLCASVPLCEKTENNSISPRAKNLAAKEGISPTAPGTGPGGRIIERDIKAVLANHAPLTAAAKAAAKAETTLPDTGTGLGGRITAADLIAHKAGVSAVSGAAANNTTAITGEGTVTETPVKGIRKLIADRMLASLSESAQFSLNANACAVQLQELRNWFKSKGESKKPAETEFAKITINDLILYTVSRVLPSYQYMNAHKTGEIYRTFERVHLGMAVDTPRGLMVPVIRNANLLSLAQIASEAKRLAAACQNGTAKPDELSGSTFTVSNLGSFGITGFTPVLNIPEVAILGVCGIELKPIETSEDDECAFGFAPHIGFSLTINHQVVDGAPAARFLKALCQAVENIYLQLAAG